jgi:rRNA maturation endonuclease Nob1
VETLGAGVGETVFEKLKRLTATAGQQTAEYQCQRCQTGFDAQRQICPECGGCHIDRADW